MLCEINDDVWIAAVLLAAVLFFQLYMWISVWSAKRDMCRAIAATERSMVSGLRRWPDL